MPVRQAALESLLGQGRLPSLDSPTYLFITRQIDGEEWVKRINASRTKMGLPEITNLQPPKHATDEEVKRFAEIMSKAPRPRLDSPTYLRITGEIDDEEYHRRLNQERQRLGLPAIKS